MPERDRAATAMGPKDRLWHRPEGCTSGRTSTAGRHRLRHRTPTPARRAGGLQRPSSAGCGTDPSGSLWRPTAARTTTAAGRRWRHRPRPPPRHRLPGPVELPARSHRLQRRLRRRGPSRRAARRTSGGGSPAGVGQHGGSIDQGDANGRAARITARASAPAARRAATVGLRRAPSPVLRRVAAAPRGRPPAVTRRSATTAASSGSRPAPRSPRASTPSARPRPTTARSCPRPARPRARRACWSSGSASCVAGFLLVRPRRLARHKA